MAMNLRKMDNGYSLQGKPPLIHRIATALGMENAKTSPIPENHQREGTRRRRRITHTKRSTKLQDMRWQSNVPQSSSSRHSAQREHTFQINEESDGDRQCEGSRSLPGYLLGTSEVYQELCPDPHAETLQVPVDSDWADDRKTRQSCSGGAVLFHGCAVLTWARTQKTRALSSAEAGIGSGAIEGLGASQLLREWQYETVPLLQTDSQSGTRGLQATRTGVE